MSAGPDRNPYDTFFHQAFGQPEPARELAINLVPGEYIGLVSSGRISVEPNRLVDESNSDHYADLLVRVTHESDHNDPEDLLVCVLIEHKSSPARWVAMQMLSYMVLIWGDERKKHGDSKPLPRIVPVVIYHGTRRWNEPTEFADLVEGTEPGDRHVPHFRPFFVNLADLTEEQLIGSLRTITALLFLKYVKHSLYEVGGRMLEVLQRAHEDPSAREISKLGMRLLATVKDREEMEYLQTIARKGRYDRVQEDEMTYAEELLQEGLERGREQGMEKGLEQGMEKGLERGVLTEKRAVLIRLLSRRFSLSASERKQIESCEDRDALDAALDEVVVADAKDSVLAKLP